MTIPNCPTCATRMQRRMADEGWICPECERRALWPKRRRGAQPGHAPTGGGRKKGQGAIMRPCGWCQAPQSAREEMRHRARCPQRPAK